MAATSCDTDHEASQPCSVSKERTVGDAGAGGVREMGLGFDSGFDFSFRSGSGRMRTVGDAGAGGVREVGRALDDLLTNTMQTPNKTHNY